MTDFEKLLRSAKETDQAKQDAERERRDAAEAAKAAKIDASIEFLTAHVRPLLEEAVRVLRKDGKDCSLLEHFDVRNRSVWVSPSLSIKTHGPTRATDNWRPDGRGVHFAAENDKLKVTAERHSVSRTGEDPIASAQGPDQVPDAVAKGFTRLVELYLEDAKEWKHLGR